MFDENPRNMREDNVVYIGHAVEPRPGRTYYEFNAQGHRIEARAPGVAI